MHNPAFDNRRLPNSRKQIIYEIYTGETVEENPGETLSCIVKLNLTTKFYVVWYSAKSSALLDVQ